MEKNRLEKALEMSEGDFQRLCGFSKKTMLKIVVILQEAYVAIRCRLDNLQIKYSLAGDFQHYRHQIPA